LADVASELEFYNGLGGFAMAKILGHVRREMLGVGLPAVLAS